ncbi:hypothetical protein AAP_00663 [Ascosphaera apis ARSEF 7405]|uniref:Uncharacterized protein n=1 Tax=Ascosphaera apis ARSEF 7405 TaxID=392613 RepID=A0A166PIK5_9EURO|nr:hypothetical protein AAP_00663 [Ascosphaera apis ARSEF 7405]
MTVFPSNLSSAPLTPTFTASSSVNANLNANVIATATATATAFVPSQVDVDSNSNSPRPCPVPQPLQLEQSQSSSLQTACPSDVLAAQDSTIYQNKNKNNNRAKGLPAGTNYSGREEGTAKLSAQPPSTTGPLRAPANLPNMGTSSTTCSTTSVPAQYDFSMPSEKVPTGVAGASSPESQCPFLVSPDKDAYCLTPRRHVRSRSLAGTLGAPHMSRAHSSPLLKGRAQHPYHYTAGPAYLREDEFGPVTSSPYRNEHLQPTVLLRTPHSKRDQHPKGHAVSGTGHARKGDAGSNHALPMLPPASSPRHEHDMSRPLPRFYLGMEEEASQMSPSTPTGSRNGHRHAYQNTFSDLNIPPITSPGGFHGAPAKFNEPYPNPLALSMPSSPSTLRSRSPSISSLETIPDIPDAEAEAVALDNQSAVEAQDRKYPWLTSSPTNLLGNATPRFGNVNRKDKRKRWSVCGGEKAYDFDLETIWED